MAITLSQLGPRSGARKDKKRVGRGLGSKGTTAGRGQKGQSSRSGVGGLKRLGMRHMLLATPKSRGFTSLNDKSQVVNLVQLSKRFIAGEIVTPRTLLAKGLIKDANVPVKLLSKGEITVALKIKNCATSESAKAKIIAAGGSF